MIRRVEGTEGGPEAWGLVDLGRRRAAVSCGKDCALSALSFLVPEFCRGGSVRYKRPMLISCGIELEPIKDGKWFPQAGSVAWK